MLLSSGWILLLFLSPVLSIIPVVLLWHWLMPLFGAGQKVSGML